MSMVTRRAVPKWPIVNFQGFDWMSLFIGVGIGAVGLFVLQKYILK